MNTFCGYIVYNISKLFLFTVGYKTIAIEQLFDHSKKENIKRASDLFPEPVNIKWLQDEFKNKLKILQRLTIVYIDVAVAHAMVSRSQK